MADFAHGAQLKLYCARTLLGRHVCKRVDMYMITLSCTWQTYALSECLLVIPPPTVVAGGIIFYP